jgi:predicted Zn-dependent peptidase
MTTRIAIVAALAALTACAPAAPPAPAPAAPPPAAPPFDPTAPTAAATEFPRTPPEPGPAPTLSLPTPERRTLSNGLDVLYVRHGSLPLVHATLLTRGGSAGDPAAAPGLAGFVASMLDEGAGGRDALQLSAALDLLGAELSTAAGTDAAFVDLEVLRSRLPEALRLMADVAARPDFPETELRRLRDERITALTSAADEPRIIAGNAFTSLVFGGEHPYGRLPAVASTRTMDRAALASFHQRYYRPEGSTLILVGDVDAGVLHPEVERAFGGWSGEAAAALAIPRADAPSATRVFLIDKPGAAQSEIRIGHPGVARSSPDYFPLVVMNTILGGSFTSRLNTNLRETHGFAYGASSGFAMRLGEGPFTASSAVFSAKTDSAVAEFFHELRRIRDEPVPADELERARNYVALGLPRRFETAAGVAAQLAELEVYGQTMDFFNGYVPRVMGVTAGDVQRVAREYLHPDRSVVVVVGDVGTVEAGLRATGVGPVEIRQVGEFVR